ncbi:MAG TPA: hypothetical protein VGP25_11605 [Gemmatimonadaceae bacterium]|jgi:hypothetical protein|nr:hypothetical protein [Gemmatimonadaceae bacterium]
MSRAFVNEDAGGGAPRRGYGLPSRDNPGYDAAAASALLEAARAGETESAETATGYYWGEPRLREHVQRILARARDDGDDRLVQLAERYLR